MGFIGAARFDRNNGCDRSAGSARFAGFDRRARSRWTYRRDRRGRSARNYRTNGSYWSTRTARIDGAARSAGCVSRHVLSGQHLQFGRHGFL